jgi:hypothetical protein
MLCYLTGGALVAIGLSLRHFNSRKENKSRSGMLHYFNSSSGNRSASLYYLGVTLTFAGAYMIVTEPWWHK